jgi:hypothetical protein
MFSFLRNRVGIGSMVLSAAAMVGVSSAHAGLTDIRALPHDSEVGPSQVLEHLYGGSFGVSGSNFTNGTITATRVDDNKDNVWFGNITLKPVASFAVSSQSLGSMAGSSGSGGYQSLFDVNQFGYLNTAASTNVSGDKYRFVLDSPGTGLRSLSSAGDNATGDQLITYKVNGLGDGKSHYLLFWEDTASARSDHDYNDLVVAATVNGKGGPVAVPLPPAAVAGGALMAGAGLLTMWKRRKMVAAVS